MQEIIDYLKVDVEQSEWDILPVIIGDNSLGGVRQMGIELHTSFHTTAEQYRHYIDTLTKLESLGFQKWMVNLNSRCTYHAEDLNRYFSHCQEVYFINMNFLRR